MSSHCPSETSIKKPARTLLRRKRGIFGIGRPQRPGQRINRRLVRNLRKIPAHRAYSQREIAKRCNCDISVIRAIERVALQKIRHLLPPSVLSDFRSTIEK